MKHKIMEAMCKRESVCRLTGRVTPTLAENARAARPAEASENKVPFVVAVQTTNGGQPDRVCMAPLPFRREAIAELAAAHLQRPLGIVSDALGCFKALADAGVHERFVTGGSSSSAKLPQFLAVNTVLGNLRAAIAETYHGFKFAKYAARYLGEFQCRFNRRYRMHELLPGLLRAMAFTTPPNTASIRAAEVAC